MLRINCSNGYISNGVHTYLLTCLESVSFYLDDRLNKVDMYLDKGRIESGMLPDGHESEFSH